MLLQTCNENKEIIVLRHDLLINASNLQTPLSLKPPKSISRNQYRSEGFAAVVDQLALLLEVNHKSQPVEEKLLEVRARDV